MWVFCTGGLAGSTMVARQTPSAGSYQQPEKLHSESRKPSLTERNTVMPTELVLVGGVLVAAGGALVFALIRRTKPVEPQHFR